MTFCCVGQWATKWPLAAPQDIPWTHKAARMTPTHPHAPLRDVLALADLPEQNIPNSKDLLSTFFRMPLLRAWLGCRKAAHSRTQSLVTRTLNLQRSSQNATSSQTDGQNFAGSVDPGHESGKHSSVSGATREHVAVASATGSELASGVKCMDSGSVSGSDEVSRVDGGLSESPHSGASVIEGGSEGGSTTSGESESQASLPGHGLASQGGKGRSPIGGGVASLRVAAPPGTGSSRKLSSSAAVRAARAAASVPDVAAGERRDIGRVPSGSEAPEETILLHTDDLPPLPLAEHSLQENELNGAKMPSASDTAVPGIWASGTDATSSQGERVQAGRFEQGANGGGRLEPLLLQSMSNDDDKFLHRESDSDSSSAAATPLATPLATSLDTPLDTSLPQQQEASHEGQHVSRRRRATHSSSPEQQQPRDDREEAHFYGRTGRESTNGDVFPQQLLLPAEKQGPLRKPSRRYLGTEGDELESKYRQWKEHQVSGAGRTFVPLGETFQKKFLPLPQSDLLEAAFPSYSGKFQKVRHMHESSEYRVTAKWLIGK